MMLNRTNRLGLSYKIREIYDVSDKVYVQTGEKAMIMNANIRQMDYAWNEWKNNGTHLQNAFPFLNQNEREFLLTGILPEG